MRFKRLRLVQSVLGGGAAVIGGLLVALLAVGGASGAPRTVPILATFTTAGTHTWTVPTGITTATFDVFGASGGNGVNGNVLITSGGAGGEAKGRLPVKAGQVFEIVVGGSGGDNSGQAGGAGGYNGGGTGGRGDPNNQPLGSAGGGGGSDVRIGGLGNTCATRTAGCEFSDRIVVGGGGGGAGQGSGGGAGGGRSGGGISGGGGGGGQEPVFPGLSTCPTGQSLGCFGIGGTSHMQAGAGGGGWFGGDAGGDSVGSDGGGGGGSGFVDRYAQIAQFPGRTHRGTGS